MKKIRVMAIDDSAIIRQIITQLLADTPDMEVIGTAINGKNALSKLPQLNPDIITLDIEMPEMDGLTALSEIKKLYPDIPVIMCSSQTKAGATMTLEALERGADDYITKNNVGFSREEFFQKLKTDLIFKIRELYLKKIKLNTKALSTPITPLPKNNLKAIINKSHEVVDIVAIGTSTGGPNALNTVLPALIEDFPTPILIVQHMPPVFTEILAEGLSKKCKFPVVEAKDGDLVEPGKVWIAPGDYHMTVEKAGNKHIIRLNQDKPENFCRPAIDVLFRSVADCFGKNALAVVMTGMGQDGMLGCGEIKKKHGQVITQDEASSVIYSMPGSVTKAGFSDEIFSLQDIPKGIMDRVKVKREFK